ncbi:MAG TPA: Rho termination factor N-terminal domain-containing protein, partial [Actinomycetota bacterium]|nr:Rho termination factor N-terminal domain-containing protein [Actinomycetota bacterium]
MATTDKRALEGKVAAELHQIAADLGIEGHKGLKKAELVDKIVAHTNGERADASSVAAATPDAAMASIDTTTSPTSGQAYVDMPETSGNGDTRQRPQPDQRDQRQRDDRREGARPQGGRPDAGQQQRDREGGPRRRPSREERRRQREERRQREIEMREEELQTAPTATGLLDVLPEGYGFLRTSGYLPGQQDIYVSLSQVRRFMLRKGDTVTGKVRQPKDSEKYFALLQIDSVNGMDPEEAKQRPNFDKLTPLFPNERFHLETGPTDVTGRIMDMVSPIGKGQRGMVVSPPKAGKTTVLKNIASGIIQSSPETHVMVLLVDERPEEVT